MFRVFLVIYLLVLNLYSLSISSNDDYNVFKTKNYKIVFTKDYINEAKYI